MQAIRWWVRPAILVLFWLILAASTIAELCTVGPALNAAAALVDCAPAIRPVARARTWHAHRADLREP